MKSLYSKFKSFERRLNTRKYHLLSKESATSHLRTIQSQQGKTDPNHIKLSDEYATDVLGSEVYAPWLHVYSTMAGEFKEGWIPNNYYGHVVVPSIKGGYGETSGLKGYTNLLFKSELFPDLVYRVNGQWITLNNEVIANNKIEEYVFENCKKIVFKKDNSGQGRGVIVISKDDFELSKITSYGNGVIQSFIMQHEFFNNIVTGSVATLRLTTVLDNNGESSVRACYLKLGRASDNIINTVSEIRVPVDMQSGELSSHGLLPSWLSINKHPDTEVSFSNKRIPEFDQCIQVVVSLQKRIPQVRCIGWDVIVDFQNSVKVMEWNGTHNGIAHSEANQGPCFSDLGWEKLWRK